MSQSSFLSIIGLARDERQHDAHVTALYRELKRQRDAELEAKYCDNWFKSLAGEFKPEHLQTQPQ